MTTEYAAPNESVSEPTTQATSETIPASSFEIPAEYADKGWTEKVKSSDDLWKTTANLQEMIGKRPAGIPTNDASDADWDTFYKAAGRPDEAKYEFSEIEGLPEGFDAEGYKTTAAEILHAAGLSQKQADNVYKAFMANELKSVSEQSAASTEAQAALDVEFDSITKEHFGDGYEAAEKAAIEAFNRHTPQSLKDSLTALEDHPKALAAVVAAINGIKGEADQVRREYGAEGKITTGGQSASETSQDVRSQLADVNFKLYGMNFQQEGYDALIAKQAELRAINSRNNTK